MSRFSRLLLPLFLGVISGCPTSAEEAGVGDLYSQLSGDTRVGGKVSLELTYVTTTEWLPGCAIMFSEHWLQRSGLQTSSPDQPGYLGLISTVEGAVFEAGVQPHPGIYGGMDSIVNVPVFQLKEGRINPGTEIRFLLSDLTLPQTRGDYQVAVFVRQGLDLPYVQLPVIQVPAEARDLSRISLSASSLVTAGNDAELWVRLEDAFGNVVSDRDLSLDLLVNGNFRNRVTVDRSVQSIEGIRFDLPGIYEVEVRTGGGGLRAVSNPIMVSDLEDRIVWASLGEHTDRSDGLRSIDEVIEAGRGYYDLVVPVDHEGHSSGSTAMEVTDVAAFRFDSLEKGSFIRLVHPDGREIDIALAETPTDLRYLAPDKLRLAQVIGADSHYHWLGETAAKHGYRTGFVAINHSHQYPRQADRIYTGIRVAPGQHWFDALAAGQTSVSTGNRVTMLVREFALEATSTREPAIDIISPVAIERVTLVKNGHVIAEQVQASESGQHFRLSLTSPNAPISGLESRPRNGREWIGYIATRDSDLSIVEGTGRRWLTQNSGGQRIDFLTRSHGVTRHLDFVLAEPTADTVLEIGFAEVHEDTAWIPVDRLPQNIPAMRFLVPLAEMQKGANRSIDANGYSDIVRVSPSPVAGERRLSFSYVDNSMPRIGDYYYFQAHLADGSMAWTSPIFVERPAATSIFNSLENH